jgi:hypothetical protein
MVNRGNYGGLAGALGDGEILPIQSGESGERGRAGERGCIE